MDLEVLQEHRMFGFKQLVLDMQIQVSVFRYSWYFALAGTFSAESGLKAKTWFNA